jgi:hypothetical protein
MSLEKQYNVNARYSFGDFGGKGECSSRVDFQTAQLMMQSPFVTINGKTLKVRTFEVTDLDTINFYGEEVDVQNGEELSLKELEEWL